MPPTIRASSLLAAALVCATPALAQTLAPASSSTEDRFLGEYRLKRRGRGATLYVTRTRGQLRVQRVSWKAKEKAAPIEWVSSQVVVEGEKLVVSFRRQETWLDMLERLGDASREYPREYRRATYTLDREDARITERLRARVKGKRTRSRIRGVRLDQPLDEKVLASSEGWVSFHEDGRFHQRYRVEKGRVWTETVFTLSAPMWPVLEALWGPWDWWRGGKIKGRRELPDRRVVFEFWPTGFLLHSEELLNPPTRLPNGGWRIRFDVRGHINGPATIDLLPTANEGCTIVSRFHGVKRGGLAKLLSAKALGTNHLLSERGALGLTGPEGTGWIGLIEQFETPSRKEDPDSTSR